MIDRSKYDEAIESYKAAWLEHGRLVIEFDEAKRSTMRELKEAGKLLSFEIEEEANHRCRDKWDAAQRAKLPLVLAEKEVLLQMNLLIWKGE